MPDKTLVATSASTKTVALANFMYLPFVLIFEQVGLQMYVLSLFLIVDYITGIAKAIKIGEKITYNRMVAGVVSKAMIFIIPLLFGLAVQSFTNVSLDYLHSIIAILSLAELYSILGNIWAFRRGRAVEDIDIVSFAIARMRGFIIKILEAEKCADGTNCKGENNGKL